MRIYTVHEQPGLSAPDRNAVLVKEGFCWPAFAFTVLWALWHRLWIAAAVMVTVAGAIEAAIQFSGADDTTATAAWLGFALAIGLGANDFLRAGLEWRGYRPLGVVAAPDRDAALRRFFDLHPDLIAQPGAAGRGTAF